MPTLAERRAQIAAQGGAAASGDFIKFKTEGETRYLRFLFTDATTIESHRKFWDEDQKKWIIDGDQGTYKITFKCVEYDKGGANPRKVRWEISEYLYNEYLSPYIEKEVPASKNVWEIKVRRPGTMDISYIAFKVDGATEITYPIPADDNGTAPAVAAPSYAQAPAQPQPAPAAPVQPISAAPVQPVAQATVQPAPAAPVYASAPAQSTITEPVQPAPRKSKYF